MLIPLHLAAHMYRHLPDADQACTPRLLCKALHLLLSETDAAIVRLGPSCSAAPPPEEAPLHAVLWALQDALTRRALPLNIRARLLEIAVSRSHTDGQLVKLEPLLQHLAAPFRSRNESRVYDPARAAAAAGNCPALLWLHARGWPVDRYGVLHAAAEHVALSVLQWLHTTFLQPPTCNDLRPGAAAVSPLLPAVAGSPNQALGKVSWLLSLGCRSTGDAACAAARCGHLPVLQLLARHSTSRSSFLDDRTLFAALQGGQLHVADWLVAQGHCSPHTGPGFRAAVRGVAVGGRVESMLWVRQQFHVRQARGAALRQHPGCTGSPEDSCKQYKRQRTGYRLAGYAWGRPCSRGRAHRGGGLRQRVRDAARGGSRLPGRWVRACERGCKGRRRNAAVPAG